MIQDWKRMIRHILFLSFVIHTLAAPHGGQPLPPLPKSPWLTLHGDEPVVVANGGLSGVFPPNTDLAYGQSLVFGKPGTVLLCDVHLTRDGQGLCTSGINLQNSTNAPEVFPDRKKTYNINGKDVQGWFVLDFTGQEIFEKLHEIQEVFSRTDVFDLTAPAPTDILLQMNATLWFNAEYVSFYNQHKLNLVDHIAMCLEQRDISYISSPEVGFLKTMGPLVHGLPTKLMLKFPADKNLVEPTTKETYGTLLTKLAMIKSFAAGIVVPREFIWPVNAARYLEPSTSLVADAHKAGLEVFAYGFANDNFLPYNYSYDPEREYLQFVENSQFAVDGVVTDFTSSASIAIACLAGSQNATREDQTLIITSNGANGDYPGSSDLAYQKAVADGADIIDCSVQMTKDNVAFCLPSADLLPTTTAAGPFMSRASKVDAIQGSMGIFSFDLTWAEIQTLKPQMFNDFTGEMARDPARKNMGKFVTLSEFLELAKAKAVHGVMINIDNAAYLAANKGLDIVGAVTTALSNATLAATQKVMIMSLDSSVLLKFKDIPAYQRVLHIKKKVEFISNQTALEVKKCADAVLIHKPSIYTQFEGESLTLNITNVIDMMHWANVTVYAGIVLNEFQDIFLDYSSDPYMLIHNLIYYGADGIVTEYPATASAYSRNLCLRDPDRYYIQNLNPGDVINYALEPATIQAYKPPPPVHLETTDFVTPALPPVAPIAPDSGSNSTTDNSTASSSTSAPAPKASSSKRIASSSSLVIFAAMLGLVSLI